MIIASDLEGTLTTGRTWKGVGEYLQLNGRAHAYRLFLVPRLVGSLIAQTGLINKQEYANQWIIDLAQLLKGFDAARLDTMAQWVVEKIMWPARRVTVLAELRRFSEAGARVILTTGTYVPIAQAFARRAGIGEVIGTSLQISGGIATGRCDGPLNNKDIKAERLRAYLGNESLDMAYGDTAADIPMQRLARTAVAVFPDRELRRAAQENGWRVLES